MPKLVKNYTEACDFLMQKLPMFSRIGAPALKPSLDNIIKFCKHLHNPQDRFPTIHIAGTNGKGTVSHVTAAMLQSQGFKVGLHASPHYKDLRERFKVNGKLASKKFVTDFVNQNSDIIQAVQPSFFEITVAMSFAYFAKEKVDFAVIEVGLGGRLDSTNIINPILSVITNISLDHTDLLGDTLPLIAIEKAGIIKKNTPIIIGEYQEEVANVFIEKAKIHNSEIAWAKDLCQDIFINQTLTESQVQFKIDHNTYQFTIDLSGPFQQKNLVTSLGILSFLMKKKIVTNFQALTKTLLQYRKSVGYIGRWQIISRSPLTIFDSAHNEGGLSYIIEELKKFNKSKIHIVIGFVADKVRSKILAKLPKDAHYYFVKAGIPRALDAKALMIESRDYGLKGLSYDSVSSGYKAARLAAQPRDVIFVGGSIFVVSELV